MMSLQTMTRTAVDGYLKLLRLPADAVAGALRPRNGRDDETTAVELALDRVEATLRDVAGSVLHDPQLREDARRRRVAANERERALELRAAADRHSLEADGELAARAETAEQHRRAAARREQEKKERVQQQRAAESRQLAQVENRRRAAVEDEAKNAEEAIEGRSRRARLEQLHTETQTLDEEQAALTARSEAQRLRRAASETKTARKS
jgi:hypothetical protein